MGKKMFKLFMETMLRAAVIVLAICIVIMLALLIKTINKNKKNEKSDTKQDKVSTELSTEEIDPDDPTFGGKGDASEDAASEEQKKEEGEKDSTDVKSAKIVVINSTGTQGVAGSWKSALEAEGYTSVEVGNYLTGVNSSTQICVSGIFDGADLAGLFNSPTMAKISDLSSSDYDVAIGDYDIVIVVGTSDIK